MSKRFIAGAAILFVAFLCAPAAHAQTAADVQIKPWSQVFANYSYNFSGYEDYDPRLGQNDANAFAFTRMRIGLDAQLSPKWFAQAALDAARSDVTTPKTEMVPTGIADDPATDEDESQAEVVTGLDTKATGQYTAFVTYAFFKYQAHKLFNWDFGMVQSSATKQSVAHWRYVYLRDIALFEYKFAHVGDMGTGIDGEVPGGYGGYRVCVLNGEGKKKAETTSGKAVEAQIHVSPFQKVAPLKGLTLMGVYRYNTDVPHNVRITETVYDALLTYRLDLNDTTGFSVSGEFVRQYQNFGKNSASTAAPVNPIISQVIAGWADFWIATKYGFVVRYDSIDPNIENDKKKELGFRDEQAFLMAGPWFEPIKQIRLCPNYRRLAYTAQIADDSGKLVDQKPDQFFYFNTEIKF